MSSLSSFASSRHIRPSRLGLGLALVAATACSHASSGGAGQSPMPAMSGLNVRPPSPDPRVGLKGGHWDAGQALWNMKLMSATRPSGKFLGSTNSDLAFTGKYAIQGNYDGYQVWDISDPAHPVLATSNYCPASQSDVSTYRNLLFVSAEGNSGRIDCGAEGVAQAVSSERIRGIRIFDITDIAHPKNVANVQTCRGSHTHSVLVDPKDADNVYVYVSGSAPVRSSEELPGCMADPNDPNTSQFRIEIIKVPLAHPEQAAIVSSPRIFDQLKAPPHSHGLAPDDKAEIDKAKAEGAFIADIMGNQMVLPSRFTQPMLDSIVKARGGSGAPTGADSAALRAGIPAMIAKMVGSRDSGGDHPGITQCHDITLYPGIGRAGGACEGYGLLLDIENPAAPTRMAAVSDSNFSYWHSATFNNDGTKILFSDEWGGGGQPKCRASDPKDWGADALFTIDNGRMEFQSYYKLPAAQSPLENCVAHNGSLIPIPGRDVMVQAFYQGGITVFDWTDIKHPQEIAFFDRGPVDPDRFSMGGSWSVYWYNGVLVSSEIARGLDILELSPSPYLTQNEIDAAKTVKLDHLNVQDQPKFVWPATFALARAYADQLERSHGLDAARIKAIRSSLAQAEMASGTGRSSALNQLAGQLDGDAGRSGDAAKVRKLSATVRDLAGR
jgi:hypothetical protein